MPSVTRGSPIFAQGSGNSGLLWTYGFLLLMGVQAVMLPLSLAFMRFAAIAAGLCIEVHQHHVHA